MKTNIKNRIFWGILLIAIAVIGWICAIFCIDAVAAFMYFIAMLATASAIGIFASCVFSRRSPHLIFAIAVLVTTAIVSAYAVWDMATDTSSFFPGLFGLILLLGVLPTAAILLLVDFLIWAYGWYRRWRASKR